jgi:hypothetical protein
VAVVAAVTIAMVAVSMNTAITNITSTTMDVDAVIASKR